VTYRYGIVNVWGSVKPKIERGATLDLATYQGPTFSHVVSHKRTHRSTGGFTCKYVAVVLGKAA
jgi:hypothetical protein